MSLNTYNIYGVSSPACSDTFCLGCAEKKKVARYLSDSEVRSHHIQRLLREGKIHRLSGHAWGGVDGWFSWKD